MSGTLYGISLGPGDPDLMTLKAARLIAASPVVAWPALPGKESLARTIAAAHIASGTREIRMDIPMTSARTPAQTAYDHHAATIADELAAGRDVAVLCEGDALFYGSFMYLMARLVPRFSCKIIPGVTSVTACAAAAGLALAARNERITVLPGPLPEHELRMRIEGAESVVIMKVGRHIGKIRRVFKSLGLGKRAVYVERASLPDERVLPLAEAPDPAPYFSMILLVKGGDPWL